MAEAPESYGYLGQALRTASSKVELYAVSAARSLALLREGGRHSFIVPNGCLAGAHLRELRILLAEANTLDELLMLPNVKVFRTATMDSVVYTCRASRPAARGAMALRTLQVRTS